MSVLDNKVAVVTGAARGPKASLGAQFALALAAQGAAVVLADTRDCAPLAAEIEAAGGSALAFAVDVSQPPEVRRLFGETEARFGRLDILVNNAAVGSNIPPLPLAELDAAAWDEVMAVNVRGAFLCAQAAAPLMARGGHGKIVNIGSTTSRDGLPQRLHYVVAKGAIETMTRALARELGPLGIRVNTLAPGLVMSQAVEQALAQRPGLRQAVLGGRAIPEDVHGAALLDTLVYLCSPASDAVTGQFIPVDNGALFT